MILYIPAYLPLVSSTGGSMMVQPYLVVSTRISSRVPEDENWYVVTSLLFMYVLFLRAGSVDHYVAEVEHSVL